VTRLAALPRALEDVELVTHDELTIEDPLVCADFRTLVMSLLWVHFFARKFTDFKLFRRLVQIESGFTYLLAGRKNRSDGTGEPQ